MNQEMKRCPLCGEEILSIAKKCKHCNSVLDDIANAKQPVVEKMDKSVKGKGKATAAMILGIVGSVIGMPAAGCSGACQELLHGRGSEVGQQADKEAAMFYFFVAIAAFIFSFFIKKKPKMSGIIFIILGVIFITNIAYGNFLALITGSCLCVGGGLSLSYHSLNKS